MSEQPPEDDVVAARLSDGWQAERTPDALINADPAALAAAWSARCGGATVTVFTAAEPVTAGQHTEPVSDTEVRVATGGPVVGTALADAAAGALVPVLTGPGGSYRAVIDAADAAGLPVELRDPLDSSWEFYRRAQQDARLAAAVTYSHAAYGDPDPDVPCDHAGRRPGFRGGAIPPARMARDPGGLAALVARVAQITGGTPSYAQIEAYLQGRLCDCGRTGAHLAETGCTPLPRRQRPPRTDAAQDWAARPDGGPDGAQPWADPGPAAGDLREIYRAASQAAPDTESYPPGDDGTAAMTVSGAQPWANPDHDVLADIRAAMTAAAAAPADGGADIAAAVTAAAAEVRYRWNRWARLLATFSGALGVQYVTELEGPGPDRDLAALPDGEPVIVAAGPGDSPEAWHHAAPGVWVALPGEATSDLTAEQVTAGQARALAAAAWTRAGKPAP